jgi:hypothetical protein
VRSSANSDATEADHRERAQIARSQR